jgi:predicted nucleotidyltransferase component of viral defense system
MRHAQESNKLVDQVFLEYCNERFLYRLSLGVTLDNYILKGGTLFNNLYVNSQRTTRDLDFLSENKLDAAVLLRDINLALSIKVEDGIIWNQESISISTSQRRGLGTLSEISFDAYLGKSRIRMQLDVGHSDVLVVEPIEVSFISLIEEQKSFVMRGYSLESIIAEKFHAIVNPGSTSTRFKDYFDLFFLVNDPDVDAFNTAVAISSTFKIRKTALPLDYSGCGIDDHVHSEAFARRWSRFLGKINGAAISIVDLSNSLRSFLSQSSMPPMTSSLGLMPGSRK